MQLHRSGAGMAPSRWLALLVSAVAILTAPAWAALGGLRPLLRQRASHVQVEGEEASVDADRTRSLERRQWLRWRLRRRRHGLRAGGADRHAPRAIPVEPHVVTTHVATLGLSDVEERVPIDGEGDKENEKDESADTEEDKSGRKNRGSGDKHKDEGMRNQDDKESSPPQGPLIELPKNHEPQSPSKRNQDERLHRHHTHVGEDTVDKDSPDFTVAPQKISPTAFKGGHATVQRLLENYDMMEPPLDGDGPTGKVDVALTFRANKLLTMDTAERTVTWAGWVRQFWYDPRLRYDGKVLEKWPHLKGTATGNASGAGPSPAPPSHSVAAASPAAGLAPSPAGVSLLARSSERSLGPKWESEKDYLLVPGDDIWKPDITVMNSVDYNWGELCDNVDAFLYDGTKTDVQVMDPSTGKEKMMPYNVFWSRPCVLKVKCDMNLAMFPFDSNICPLVFQPWGDNFLDMMVPSSNSVSYITIPEFAVNMINTTAETSTYQRLDSEEENWPKIVVRMQITRHGHYYVVNFVCPSLLMILLTWISFWIPPAGSDRIAFMVTVVLTVMAVSFITADKRPATDADMWLDDFQVRCMLMVVSTTFYTVWLHRWLPEEDWEEWRITTRRALIDRIEQLARLGFPLIVIVFLAPLFWRLQVFKDQHADVKTKDFSGSATVWTFIGLGTMAVVLFCAMIAKLFNLVSDEAMEKHVHRKMSIPFLQRNTEL